MTQRYSEFSLFGRFSDKLSFCGHMSGPRGPVLSMILQVAIALRAAVCGCSPVGGLEGVPLTTAETAPTSNPLPGVCHPGLVQVSGETFE